MRLPLRLYLALYVLLAISGCGPQQPAPGDKPAAEDNTELSGHQKMVRLLGEYAEIARAENRYYGDSLARNYGEQLKQLPDSSPLENRWKLCRLAGVAELRAGNEEKGIKLLETAVGLLPSYDTRKFEDLIEGQRANADFTLVECKLTEQRGSGKNRRTVTTFQGLLLNIDYPDRFLGRTLIARDGWWSWGRKNGMQQVDLVSKELEDAFTVYSTDQVEARTLLTPDRMERLIALERHFKGGKLRGVFEEGHLTLALEADNQFEAGSIFKPLADPDRYVETLTEIGLVCDLIDGFLTREWYKDKI